MKNAFCFILKALSFLKIFKFLFYFSHAEKRLDKKDKVDFKLYVVKKWETNNYNEHTSHISGSNGSQALNQTLISQ